MSITWPVLTQLFSTSKSFVARLLIASYFSVHLVLQSVHVQTRETIK